MPGLAQWKEIRNYPVIIGIGLRATGVTIAWWAGANVSPLFESAEIRRVWRLVTSVLPHQDICDTFPIKHRCFNLFKVLVEVPCFPVLCV
jgi:hypothetical protein